MQTLPNETEHFSGADVKGIVDKVVESKLSEALATGKPAPIITKDIIKIIKKCRATTREWLSSAKNHALYANQDGTYDDVLAYLKVSK